MIVQQPCAHCGKPLSPYWREKCLHCGTPLYAAAPAGMAPVALPVQVPVVPPVQVPVAPPVAQVPARVQNVLRGPTQEACLQLAAVDAQQAAAHGYRPIWQTWGQEGGLLTLTVLYELAGPIAQPPAAVYAAVPGPTSVPQPTAPAQQPAWSGSVPMQPAAPAQQPAWSGPAQAQPGPVAPAWSGPGSATLPSAGPAPTGQAPGRTISNRVIGAIVSIIVFIVAYLVYSALNRALY